MYLYAQTTATTRHAAEALFPLDVAPAELELSALVQRCVTESERFYRGVAHDSSFAFELFRRALVDQSEVAWEHIYGHYSPLVESWVRRCGAFAQTGETSEFFVVSAFTKFWRAMRNKPFESFPNLAALLHYLQLCTSCVVIDSVRAQSWAEMLPEEALATTADERTNPDEAVLDRAEKAEIWGCVNTLVSDCAERVILYESFVLGMKPGEIFTRHGALFSSITVVYNTKRNLLERLGRNQQLRCLVGI